MNIDQIYIIILPERYTLYASKCIERLVAKGFDLSKVTFFNGINGNNPEKPFKTYEGWCIPNHNNSWWNRPVSNGEIGCGLSHYYVWKDAYIKGYNNILILEEDFYFYDNFDMYIKTLMDVDYDMFYLGRNLVEHNTSTENVIVPKYTYCTHAYLLNKYAIETLYWSKYTDNLIPVDEFLNLFFLQEHTRTDLHSIDYRIRPLKTFTFRESIIGQTSNGKTEI